MDQPCKILVVDDTPANLKLLTDLLTVKGYEVAAAESGHEALARIEADCPDLVLLDVMMPGMDGYEVCKKIRQNPATEILPVVMVTALDPSQERIKGIEAGADDFLGKPVNQQELLARVRSLLRVKEYYNTIQDQKAELADWNKKLESRVEEQLAQLEKMDHMKRFLSPHLAKMVMAGEAADPLKPHRSAVTVVYIDLRGFTAFSQESEPEEIMTVLNEYHAEMGALIQKFDGTIDHFVSDGIMVIFNDPVPVPNPTELAIRMVIVMRDRMAELKTNWQKRGYELDCGFGIAHGYATIGAIGFGGRWDYSTIGTVANMACRLCDEAKGPQIILDQKTLSQIEDIVEAEPLGLLDLKGFSKQINAFNVVRLKSEQDD
jgi:CheY-like chemotaxis protein/class 3 adenylate cyclase